MEKRNLDTPEEKIYSVAEELLEDTAVKAIVAFASKALRKFDDEYFGEVGARVLTKEVSYPEGTRWPLTSAINHVHAIAHGRGMAGKVVNDLFKKKVSVEASSLAQYGVEVLFEGRWTIDTLDYENSPEDFREAQRVMAWVWSRVKETL